MVGLFISMKPILLACILTPLSFILTSCEGELGCSGTIRSAQTLMPIAGAKVLLLRNRWPSHSTITDSAGRFSVSEFVGISVFGDVPQPGLLIDYPGYQPLYIPNANTSQRTSLQVDSLELYLAHYPVGGF